jgi:hypothetical protein
MQYSLAEASCHSTHSTDTTRLLPALLHHREQTNHTGWLVYILLPLFACTLHHLPLATPLPPLALQQLCGAASTGWCVRPHQPPLPPASLQQLQGPLQPPCPPLLLLTRCSCWW